MTIDSWKNTTFNFSNGIPELIPVLKRQSYTIWLFSLHFYLPSYEILVKYQIFIHLKIEKVLTYKELTTMLNEVIPYNFLSISYIRQQVQYFSRSFGLFLYLDFKKWLGSTYPPQTMFVSLCSGIYLEFNHISTELKSKISVFSLNNPQVLFKVLY